MIAPVVERARVIETKVEVPVIVQLEAGDQVAEMTTRHGLAIQRGDAGRIHTERDLGTKVFYVDGIPMIPNIFYPVNKFLTRRDLQRRADAINQRIAAGQQ